MVSGDAGRAKWILLLNKKYSEGKHANTLGKQKLIIGLLSRWVKETGTYAVQYIVMSNPQDDSIAIMVVRTDGEVFYRAAEAR